MFIVALLMYLAGVALGIGFCFLDSWEWFICFFMSVILVIIAVFHFADDDQKYEAWARHFEEDDE